MNDYPRFGQFTDYLKNFGVLDKIYADFSDSKYTAEQSFEFAHAVLKRHDMLLPVLHKPEFYKPRIHDHVASHDHRRDGNRYFKAGKYSSAIITYTLSLSKSVPGSECHAIAFANRSAALFHIGDYQHCLNDIRRALQSEYPTGLKYKLYERAGNAERILGHGVTAKKNYLACLVHADKSTMSEKEKRELNTRVTDAIASCEGLAEQKVLEKNISVDQLLGGKNEKIPALSTYLELKNSKMGRGVYATRDIKPGDVVVIDDPYIGISHNSVCNNFGCLKFFTAGILCPHCSLVYYCSEECIQKASLDGHYIECSIMYTIKTIPGIQELNELALRWFLKECSKIGLEKYCLIVNNIMKTKNDSETEGFDENGLYKSDSFLTAFSLKNIQSKLSVDVRFFFNCIAVEILHYLMLSGYKIPECYVNTVGASLVHMLYVFDLNCRKFILYDPSSYALYPSVCLLNHSCDPNVKRSGVLTDRISVLKAIQPIPKGSQLFISNGVDFKVSDKSSRDLYLVNQFKSRCICKPCIENWPTSRFIPKRLSSLNILNPVMTDTVTSECKKFLKFKKKTNPKYFYQHLNYLYSFSMLMYDNVKRPFELYEDCVAMISAALVCMSDNEHKTFSEFKEL